MQHKNENVDLPSFGNEWQRERNGCPRNVHRHQEGPARQSVVNVPTIGAMTI
jgi:hypothetical protein